MGSVASEPLLVLSPILEPLGPSRCGGYVATRPNCSPLVILYLALKRRAPPRRQGLCSHLAGLSPISDFVPAVKRWGPPRPLLIFPSDVKLWRPLKRQGLYSHLAHLWATSNFQSRFGALQTPRGASGYVASTCGPLLRLSLALKHGGPSSGMGYVATRPTRGPRVIFSPALERSAPPRRQGLCSPVAHLWSTCEALPPFLLLSFVLPTASSSKGLRMAPRHAQRNWPLGVCWVGTNPPKKGSKKRAKRVDEDDSSSDGNCDGGPSSLAEDVKRELARRNASWHSMRF